MKQILVLGCLLLMACKLEPIEHKVIHSKTPFSFGGELLSNDYCRYFYKKDSGNTVEFTEKCDKYNIGDTLKGL